MWNWIVAPLGPASNFAIPRLAAFLLDAHDGQERVDLARQFPEAVDQFGREALELDLVVSCERRR
jgi:hypothetical protein